VGSHHVGQQTLFVSISHISPEGDSSHLFHQTLFNHPYPSCEIFPKTLRRHDVILLPLPLPLQLPLQLPLPLPFQLPLPLPLQLPLTTSRMTLPDSRSGSSPLPRPAVMYSGPAVLLVPEYGACGVGWCGTPARRGFRLSAVAALPDREELPHAVRASPHSRARLSCCSGAECVAPMTTFAGCNAPR
jgi:hypothetical protein